ncbi:MAG: RIP metalloprotease RseP [Bacillota bacterium]|nr:RIP metalloprotease RseP [Bacillota bacterium]
MTLLLSILAFNIIIIVHEFGHFIVAKLCKIQVLEFSLFFGPKIFSVQIGETLYSLRTIPALAYVRLEGEEEESDSERSFGKKSVLTRMAVIAAGPLANILLATVLLMIIISFTGYETTKTGIVLEGSPAYEAGIRKGEIVKEYDNKAVYSSYDQMLFLVGSKGKEAQVKIERGGKEQVLNIKPLVIPGDRLLLGFKAKETYGKDSNVVDSLMRSQPDKKNDLKPGDRIIRIDNQPISSMTDILNYLNSVNPESTLAVYVKRGVDNVQLNIKPFKDKGNASYDIGMAFSSNVKGSFGDVVREALKSTYSYTRISVYSMIYLFQGKFSFREVTGPVGMVAAMNEVVQHVPSFADKILSLFNLMVFITIGLGIANLLPIPPADGSKLVLLTLEAVRRKPLPAEKERMVMAAGFVFMMILFVVVLCSDIFNIFTRFGVQ